MRASLAIGVLVLASAASAQMESHYVNVNLDIDGTVQSAQVPRFNRPGATLQQIRIRGYYRVTANLRYENRSDQPGIGRASFRPGANLAVDLGAGNLYYVMFVGATTKGREVSLSAFDGTFDWTGTSGGSIPFSATQAAAVTLSDPTLIAAMTGAGNLNLQANAGAQVEFRWYRTPSRTWPDIEASGSGLTSFVITYVYTTP